MPHPWEAFPSLPPSLGEGPTACCLYSHPWIYHAVASPWVSKMLLVRGRASFHASQPLEWLGQTWARWNQPSSYKQAGRPWQILSFCLCFIKWKGLGSTNIMVCQLICLIHSEVMLLEGRGHHIHQCMAGTEEIFCNCSLTEWRRVSWKRTHWFWALKNEWRS